MKFFKPEDFKVTGIGYEEESQRLAALANAKIEREGAVVYGKSDYRLTSFATDKNIQFQDGSFATHKALLINIESIEKCRHPKEKVKEELEFIKKYSGPYSDVQVNHKCDCGAKVTPASFEVVE